MIKVPESAPNKNFELIFERDYLNEEKHENGKKYYKDYKLQFEGEYLNGKRWNVNGYYINGKKEFEIKDGKGYIKEYD